jgi:saccharopine dehydrogenase (NADP+, L-glutamate forming)
MSDSSPRLRTVHWVGTGLSTGSGALMLARRPGISVVLWGRTEEKAATCARRVGLPGDVGLRGLDNGALAAALAPADVVISMLPASEHAALLASCVEHRAHFACSSFTSPAIVELSGPARAHGLVVVTEAGLDPGIDHLLARSLLAQARAAVGDGQARVSLRSYCGGMPAFPDEFRYRFTWAPRGVLTALLAPARYFEGGQVRTVDRVWEAVEPYQLGEEELEAYPNRDSVSLAAMYRLPSAWEIDTFVRGTLRPTGWRAAWSDVFAALHRDGMACVDELAERLARDHSAVAGDPDRVVLTVEVEVVSTEGKSWAGRYALDLTGTDRESAMARTVSTPLAVAVGRLLDRGLAPGLHRGAETPMEARRWLDGLRPHGITARYDTTGVTSSVTGGAR